VGLKRILPASTGDTDSEQEAAGATIIPEPGSLIADLLDMDLGEAVFQRGQGEAPAQEVARTSCLLEDLLNPTVFLETFLAWEEQLMLGMLHPSMGKEIRDLRHWVTQEQHHPHGDDLQQQGNARPAGIWYPAEQEKLRPGLLSAPLHPTSECWT
jgi:hypothetical protein